MRILSKPPTPPRMKGGRFSKRDFDIDMERRAVTCPAGVSQAISGTAERAYAAFSAKTCGGCTLAEQCLPKSGRRVVSLHRHEALHQAMAAELATPRGRAARRERVRVEHALARLGATQGNRARYRGLEKNQAHAEASAVVTNLYVLDRLYANAA